MVVCIVKLPLEQSRKQIMTPEVTVPSWSPVYFKKGINCTRSILGAVYASQCTSAATFLATLRVGEPGLSPFQPTCVGMGLSSCVVPASLPTMLPVILLVSHTMVWHIEINGPTCGSKHLAQ